MFLTLSVRGPLACLCFLGAENAVCRAPAVHPSPGRGPRLLRPFWVYFLGEPRAVSHGSSAVLRARRQLSLLSPTPPSVAVTVAVLVGVRWGPAMGLTCFPDGEQRRESARAPVASPPSTAVPSAKAVSPGTPGPEVPGGMSATWGMKAPGEGPATPLPASAEPEVSSWKVPAEPGFHIVPKSSSRVSASQSLGFNSAPWAASDSSVPEPQVEGDSRASGRVAAMAACSQPELGQEVCPPERARYPQASPPPRRPVPGSSSQPSWVPAVDGVSVPAWATGILRSDTESTIAFVPPP